MPCLKNLTKLIENGENDNYHIGGNEEIFVFRVNSVKRFTKRKWLVSAFVNAVRYDKSIFLES
jgi:hypothetical protein